MPRPNPKLKNRYCLTDCMWSHKGIVHPKNLILSLFINPDITPNLYDCMISAEHKRYLKNVGNQSTLAPIDIKGLLLKQCKFICCSSICIPSKIIKHALIQLKSNLILMKTISNTNILLVMFYVSINRLSQHLCLKTPRSKPDVIKSHLLKSQTNSHKRPWRQLTVFGNRILLD